MTLRRLAVAMTLLAAARLSAATAIRVISRDTGTCVRGTVRATPVCDSCALPEQSAAWTSRDGVADVQLDLGSDVAQWRVQAIAENCWSAGVIAAANAEALSLPILPAARLRAALEPPRGTGAPESLQLRVSSVRDGAFPESTVDCARARERWLCEVPAAPLDVRLSADGFVPHYAWGLQPDRGSTLDLGTIRLRRGASVSGRAAVGARDAAGPITVTLSPDAFSDPAASGLRTLTGTTNARGFFQFAGIEPGRWTVSATKPGWSSATTKVAVGESGEAALPSTLLLEPLATLEVVLDPPQDAGGADWNVTLQRHLDEGGDVRIAAGPSSAGVWKAAALERGMYVVTVTSADGAVVYRRGDLVFDGMPPLRIAINVITVSGTVRLGDEPVAARLELVHRLGKRAVLQAAEDGTFSGVLPLETPSRWDVKVRPSGSRTTLTINNLDLEPVDGRARADIEFPGGTITGKVVDEAGQPLPALVRVRRDAKTVAEASTPSDGTFTIRGLEEGSVELQALGRSGGDSGYIAHEVRDSDDDPITIVAPKRRKVQVQVVTPGGRPYAGAIVRVLRSGRAVIDEVTSPTGRFPVHAPAQDTVAHAIVIAPGYGVAMRTIPLDGDDSARRIVLSPLFGQVWVPAGERWDHWPGIAAAGMPVVGLYSWIEPGFTGGNRPVNGGRVLNLEPGAYRFCADVAEQVCVDRVVTPGSQQKIEFPP